MFTDAPRKALYTASRTCANTWANSAHFAAIADRDELRGLLTLALYTALCEKRFGGMPGSLGKDRTQPLPKVGVDDLARLVLPAPEQAGLVACIQQVATSARGMPASLRTLARPAAERRRRRGPQDVLPDAMVPHAPHALRD
ncbi:hypothetical protein COCOR_03453 [Corallococcus coralloides DSM 2259]|uniref:Uncharacterized protein n=2 Tax=Corallococcus coralloides TaxID=184914 RepID=H8MKI9_CORCM|nr:hypothetical protein COCOR_03453 [Corallococcus coralloides DSM 2259]